MVLTMSAVAENKGIELAKLDVKVVPHIVEERGKMSARLETQIHIGDGLTRRERVILFNSARRCEVHKLLSGEFEFDFELLSDASSA